MRLMLALGGNALLEPSDAMAWDAMERHVSEAAAQIAPLAKEHEIVLVHGNGPQIGMLALQSAAYAQGPQYPLDALGAQTQGMIGYLIQNALMNQGVMATTIVSQVGVDRRDPAFKKPSKPIGPFYQLQEKDELLQAHPDWVFEKKIEGFRRVVPSPLPQAVLGHASLASQICIGQVVIAAGGGGIPCVREKGCWSGVEAVVDKDLTAALLAVTLGCERLIILTNVGSVYRDFGTPQAVPIHNITARAMRSLNFEAGSMAPKVQAACSFVETTGGKASIGHLKSLSELLSERLGTHIVSENDA